MTVAATLMLAILATAEPSQSPQAPPTRTGESPSYFGFFPGEEISFSVDYLSIPTGQGKIAVGQPEGDIWPVVCQARTDGVAGVLDIREFYVSYWNAAAKLPHGSDLHAIEMGDRHTDISRFNRTDGKATVRIQRKGRRSERTHDVPANVQDPASAVFFLRSQSLATGDHFELPVFTGEKVFTLVADVGARERVKTPAGRFDAYKVQIRTAFGGKFTAKRDTFIWFSDDARHIPIQISADFAIGAVVVSMTRYKPGSEVAQR